MEKVKTPTMIWQDYDPTELPLEISEVSVEQKDELTFERFYFSGRAFESGEKSRVFAVVCSKKSNLSKPSVLLIDSPEKPISESDLAFLASNGFVAMAVDLKGQTGVEGQSFTVYPEEVSYANFCESQRFAIRETASETMWFEYALNCMRAVSVLSERYNSKKISVLSVHDGSLVGLIVSAIDKRLFSGAVVFGNLNVEIEGRIEIDETSEREKIEKAVEQNELLDIWTMGLAPQSYVPLINIPMYIVCSGNSRSADVLTVSEMFSRLNESSRLLVLPNTVDYICDELLSGVVRWLKGGTADCEAKLSLTSNPQSCTVEVQTTGTEKSVELWYTRDNTKPAKNWVLAPLTNVQIDNNHCYTAELDLYEQTTNLSIVAVCRSKISISTPVVNTTVKQSSGLKLPTSVLYGGEASCFVALNKLEGWHGPTLKAEGGKGYLNIRGTKGSTFGTFACTDKCVSCLDSDTLSFDVCCDVKQEMTITYVVNFGSKQEESFVSTAKLLGDGKWQRVTLNHADFKRVGDGHSMGKSCLVDLIIFDCQDVFLINNVYVV